VRKLLEVLYGLNVEGDNVSLLALPWECPTHWPPFVLVAEMMEAVCVGVCGYVWVWEE